MNSARPRGDRPRGRRDHRPGPAVTHRAGLAAAALLVGLGACGRIGFTLLALPSDDAGASGHPDASLPDAAARDATTTHDAGPVEASGDDADVEQPGLDGGLPEDAAQPDASSAVDGGDGGCVTSSIVNYCTALPFLPAPPVIDGVLDCGPTLIPIVAVGWTGPGVVPAGNSAMLAAAWRPDGLYFYVAVTCPSLILADPGEYAWEGNGVELYVDHDGLFPNSPMYDSDGGTSQLVTEAPDSGTSTSTTGEIWRNAAYLGPWTSSTFELFGTPTGYVLEAFVAAADLDLVTWSLSPGGMVGLNVAVNVTYASPTTTGNNGHRLGQFFMYLGPPPAGGPFSDVRSFCTPTLSE